MAVVPPFAAGVGLIPPVADAGLAGAAVMEEHGQSAGLGPIHLRLPFVGPQTAAADVVLDDVGRMFAFDVENLAIDDEVLFLIDRLNAHEHDVGGLIDNRPETHGRFDIGNGRGEKTEQTTRREQGANEKSIAQISYSNLRLSEINHGQQSLVAAGFSLRYWCAIQGKAKACGYG